MYASIPRNVQTCAQQPQCDVDRYRFVFSSRSTSRSELEPHKSSTRSMQVPLNRAHRLTSGSEDPSCGNVDVRGWQAQWLSICRNLSGRAVFLTVFDFTGLENWEASHRQRRRCLAVCRSKTAPTVHVTLRGWETAARRTILATICHCVRKLR